jgi:hypothetical protein
MRNSTRIAAAAALLSLGVARDARAQTGDTTTTRDVGPGVTLRRIVRAEGPETMYVLEVNLHQPLLMVRAVRACDRGTGRERPSAMARRLRASGFDVVAAINAGFFDLEGGTGASESNVVVDGEIAKAVLVTESPFDKFDNVHSQFGMTTRGHPVIDRFRLTGGVRTRNAEWPLAAINGAPVADGVAIYTRWSDAPPRFPAGIRSAAVPIALRGPDTLSDEIRGVTWRYRVLPAARDTVADTTGTHALLVGTGTTADRIARLKPGDVVDVDAYFTPDRGRLRTIVGGWPRLVKGGVNVATVADSVEGTFPRFGASRHPRSAVGFSRDSSTLYLVAVDGRQTSSAGMSLVELAQALISLGVYDALNLDGGGSTALVVGDSVVNHPSDATGERAVGDALVITRETAGHAKPHNAPSRTIVASCVRAGNRDPDRLPPPASAAPAPVRTPVNPSANP